MKKAKALFVLCCFVLCISGCISKPPVEPTESTASVNEVSYVLSAPDIIFSNPCAYCESTGEALYLGMELNDVIDVLGQPEKDDGAWLHYSDDALWIYIENEQAVKYCFLGEADGWVLPSGVDVWGGTESQVIEAMGQADYSLDDYNDYSFDENMVRASGKNAKAVISFSYDQEITTIAVNDSAYPVLQASNVISVFGITTNEPNSASGVDVNISFANNSDAAIKYAYFTLTPCNAVDDAVSSEIGDESEITVKVTGPIEADGMVNTCTTENAWYNDTITYAVLSQVSIEYMDGTTAVLQTR